MATWAEFESAEPEMAALAATLWPGPAALHTGAPRPAGTERWFEVAYLATIRPDGGPRLHPFCPILAAGRLYAAIPAVSPKGHDLRRDPRCVVHAKPGPDDLELCIRGHGIDVSDVPGVRDAVRGVVAASGIGGMIETARDDRLFEIDLRRVDVAQWLDVGQAGTRAERRRWRPIPPS